MNKRSQISIGDFFLAASIFIILMGSVVLVYDRYTSKFDSREAYNRIQLSSIQAADMLARSGGEPKNWELNSSSARMIGLARSDRNISVQKLDSFLNMSYNYSKDVMRIDGDYYFKIVGLSGNIIAYKGMNATGRSAAGVSRIVLYNDEYAVMSFILWKE